MPDKVYAEIYLAMNESGEWETGKSAKEAAEHLTDNQGGYICRIAKINARMAPPEFKPDAEADLDIPDTAGETTKLEVEAE